MSEFIKLPSERVEQLRTLSKNLDMPIADCIAMFVREQIAKGNLPDEVPGITVKQTGNNIALDLGAFTRVMTKDIATAYAAQVHGMLTAIATPSKANPFMPEIGLDVARRGTSIKLIDRTSGAEKTLARSVAEDFARVLSQAAE
jgi:hypothetical protein